MSQDSQNQSLNITLKKSPIGFEKTQKATVAALGLRKVGATVRLPDNASVRGMVFKVKHLLEVTVMKLLTLSQSTAGSRLAQNAQARWPRHRQRPRQNLDARPEGPARPEPRRGRFRRRPDAVASPPAQIARQGQRRHAAGPDAQGLRRRQPDPTGQAGRRQYRHRRVAPRKRHPQGPFRWPPHPRRWRTDRGSHGSGATFPGSAREKIEAAGGSS